MLITATFLALPFVRVDFFPKPKVIGSKSSYSTEFVFPLVHADKGHFLVENSLSSFAVSTQEMTVTFAAHKVMHFDGRHRANPSNRRAQTTAHCPPEASCYSWRLITFSRSAVQSHSEYQEESRKATLLLQWKRSSRSTVHS